MVENGKNFGKVVQVSVVVRNIEQVAENWARLLGVEKPKVIETEEWDRTHMMYRGEPSSGRAKLAFFNFENIVLELIEPVGGPSTWSEFLEKHGPGIHHIAFEVRDMDKGISKLEESGGELVQRGNFTGGSYAYVDACTTLGAIIELLNYK
ncbi:MAG: VOC family protein [Thermofilaceae archaeon]